jgi:hypothetical protein
MRTDGKKNKQTATALEISKLSTVQNPAHAPALAAIIKESTITNDDIEKQTFMDALAEINLEEQTEEFMDSIWNVVYALRKSIGRTINDDSVTNKKEIIQSNIADFATTLSGLISTTNVIKAGGNTMKPEEIQKMVNDAVAPIKKELDVANAIIKMDVTVRGYYDSLDEQGKEDFLKMSAEDQSKTAAPIAKKSTDESVIINGQTIQKSVVGDDIFAVMKSQQDEIAKSNAAIQKERDARELIEFTKQAEGMYPNLPGEASAKGKVIKAISTFDADTRATLDAMLKAGNESLAKAFDETGTASAPAEGDNTAVAQLNKMAETYAADNKVTFAKAYDAVLKTTEGLDLYEQSLKK